MGETKVESEKPKRGRGLRWLAGIVAGLVVLLVVAYFVVTSGAFFKSFVLPKVSTTLNAEVTVADASISPFSQVVLRGLEVKPKGAETLLTAAEVRARYSLLAILRGTIAVEEVAVVAPKVNLVQKADGTSNLDPILNAFKTPAPPPPPPGQPAKPLAIDIKTVTLSNGALKQVTNQKGGGQQTVEISSLNINLSNLKNGQTAKADLSADIKFDNHPAAPGTNAALQARLTGNFAAALSPDLQPTAINAAAQLAVNQAAGAFSDLATLTADLQCEVTPTAVKQIALNFSKGAAALGQVRVGGPFDLNKREGRLAVDLSHLDRNVLNLAGGAAGMDFGSSMLNSTNQIVISATGKTVAVVGQLTGSSLSVSQKGLTTPALDVAVGYDVTVDQPKQTATIQALTLDATRQQQPLLQGRLAQPMTLTWAAGANAVEESAFDLTLSDLNLADWRAFLGTNISSGVLTAKLGLISQKAGQQLAFAGTTEGRDLSAAFGSNRVDQAGFGLQWGGSLAGFRQLALTNLAFRLSQRGQPVASAQGSGAVDVKTKDGTFAMKLDGDLPGLAALAGTPGLTVSGGRLDARLDLTSQKSAQQLDFSGTVDGSGVSASLASNRLDQAGFSLRLAGSLAESRQLQLTNLALKFTQRGQPVASAQAAGSVDLKTMDAALGLQLDADLPGLAALAPVPAFEASSGSLKFDGNLKQTSRATGAKTSRSDQAVQGNLTLANFTGRYAEYRLSQLGVAAACDLGVRDQQASIRKLNATLQQAGQAGGTFDMTGDYNLTNQTGSVALKLADLNQNVLRPFLAGALGGKQLVSVSINANLSGSYDPEQVSALKGELQVTNLVVRDPKGQLPATPLEARLQLDTALQKKVAELRDCSLAVTPTDRAKNQLQVTGRVDFTQTNAITGNVKLAADSLDATRYYDLFSGPAKATTAASPAPATTPAPAPAAVQTEPAAIHLPLKNFIVAANVGAFYLGEVAITNFQTTLKLDGGEVLLKPFQLALNGAPINGTVDLDLGVPGFKYDLNFQANAVPLAPLVNTFQPERKGQVGGTATAGGQIKGAGVTGASLQKNLAGQFDIFSTNLNLSVVNVRSPIMKSVVNIIIGIPDFISNPGAGLGNFLSRMTGVGGKSSGWLDQLTQSPIDAIIARGSVGDGRLGLQEARVQSPAFQAAASGTVTLAAVLTNSILEIPVAVSLSQPLASKVGLVPAGTPTNAVYVKLPDFVTIQGTVGEPKEKINYLALASVAAKAGAGIIGRTGESAVQGVSGLAGAVGGLLGGGTNATATATNRAGSGILGTLDNLLGGGKTSPSNAPPATNQPVIRDLLDLFKKK